MCLQPITIWYFLLAFIFSKDIQFDKPIKMQKVISFRIKVQDKSNYIVIAVHKDANENWKKFIFIHTCFRFSLAILGNYGLWST